MSLKEMNETFNERYICALNVWKIYFHKSLGSLKISNRDIHIYQNNMDLPIVGPKHAQTNQISRI